ncbi:hypothetical protein EUGRSUZ_H03796 [Eucalyptus grandis]|uniref:Uncharacterized protein n=2 Tax=Eucalyptus grandis TaxID=71139 RepID=A0ACC3JW44_EUCGR|nr:hypothetical protein EUGRSUZ_H03796 [Eucalyptus grandis]
MERNAKRRQGEQVTSMERGAKRRRTGGNDGTARGASSTHASTEGQEVATSSGYDYEVFLSFRGPDTRVGFIDFLYTSMIDMGIRAYKDDEDLPKGEEFGPKLLQAIEQSKILMPIFSNGYASSVWCLKELVKMVECQKTKGQKIMPIFYDVAPLEVQHQTGNYGEAFRSHERKRRHDEKTVQEWKDALTVVGQINGWNLQSMPNRREGEFIRKVTQKVFTELKKAYLAVSECLVRVDNHVIAIMEMIGAGTSETRIIGIHGMGGIGKTTTAKMIYNKLLDNFDNCCFLQDIRETSKGNGIQCSQNQLISVILKRKCVDIKDIHEGTQMIKERLFNKKVLLLFDDVEEANHINALVGKRDWLGRGSKIIITTRNKDILEVPEVDCSYELSCMDHDQSLQLFSKHAFRKENPLDEYINQSKRAIRIARGLPLALEVIGSLLCHTKKEKWDLTLKKLENVPHVAVQSKLKISYDALDVRQRHIFLDIACLFIGYNKDIVVHFWHESKFPEEAMEVLQNMSLIKIEQFNKVWMHDQLRDLGREIVYQESKMKIEKQSRVWDPKEALDLLRRPEGKEGVEALHLKFDHKRWFHFTYKSFKSFSNLRFLQVDNSEEYSYAKTRPCWNESPNVFPEDSNLLPQLRWLSWHYIPPSFKISNFSMEDVVILDLSWSNITHEWQGWSHMKVMRNLKVLNLYCCARLERTPNFSAQSNLEHLILSECWDLDEIDKSICQLKRLVSLRVDKCWKLRRLPQAVGRDLATQQHCNSSDRLSDTIGNLESLIELDISRTEIEELPDSIGKWKNLKVVKIGSAIHKIPDALWMIKSLEEIEVEVKPDFDVEIGDCIFEDRCLRSLRLTWARINKVPRLPESLEILTLTKIYMDTFPDLSNLVNLKDLTLVFGPRNDGGESGGPVEAYPMPRWIENLSKLQYLVLCSDYVTTLPTDLSSILPRLKSLSLKGDHLRCPPSLPSSLSGFTLRSEYVTTLPKDIISLLPQLRNLSLSCPNLHCLPSHPSALSFLSLKSKCVTTLPTDLSSLLPRLERLWLECPNLGCLPSLPSSLSELELTGCKSSFSLGNLSYLKELSYLCISDCAISEIQCHDPLENLQRLRLWDLPRLETLPSLGNFNKLRYLYVSECGNLVEIQGELPQSLEVLKICKCGSLKELPDLSPLKGLKTVRMKRCGNLDVEAISTLCCEKSVEFGEEDSDVESESQQEEDEFEFESESDGEGDEYEEEDDKSEYEEEDDE